MFLLHAFDHAGLLRARDEGRLDDAGAHRPGSMTLDAA